MLMEVGVASVHSQNDHHPNMEARSESIVTVSDSELEESRMTSPEPNGLFWAEKHSSERVEELSVESRNDTGQQESTVLPDQTLGLEGSGSTLEDSKDISDQPNHTMAYKGSGASSGLSVQCWASNDGPYNAPLLDDTVDDPQQTPRPEDISGHQHHTISSEEVCHQGDHATEQEDISNQPSNSPESAQIHHQTNNTAESTLTIHQPKNIQECDKVSDQQGTTRELEKTSDQPHNTMEREEISDQPDKINNKVYNIVTSNGIGDQTDNTTKPEISAHSDTFNDQENSTPGSIEICDEYSNSLETNAHEQPTQCMGFKERSDQHDDAGEFTIISDLHTTIEREEISSEPLCLVELKEMNDQPEKCTSSEENNLQPHSDSNCKSICDQVHHSTESKCVCDNPDHAMESKVTRDQAHTATESECIDHQVCTHEESKDPSDRVHNTMESEEFNDPEVATRSKEMFERSADIIEPKERCVQPNNTRESKEICDHQTNITESKEITYKPEDTPETNEMSVQSVIVRETRKKSDQADNILDSEEKSDQPANLKGPKGISDESDNTGLSFEIRAHSAISTESPKIGNQLDSSSETRENSDQLVNAAETKEMSQKSESSIVLIEITDEPENVIESEENSNQSPIIIESKVISSQPDHIRRSKNINEEPGLLMESKEVRDEPDTTNVTDNCDQPANLKGPKGVSEEPDSTRRSKNINEEPGLLMEPKEMSDEPGTTIVTDISDRLPNTAETFGNNSTAFTVVNFAESNDEYHNTNHPKCGSIDDLTNNVNSKDLDIAPQTGMEPAESCQGPPDNRLNGDSMDMSHMDALSRLAYDGFPRHTDALESNDSGILGAQDPGFTETGTIGSKVIELNEAVATSPHTTEVQKTSYQPDTIAEEADTKDCSAHQESQSIRDNPEDESSIRHPTVLTDESTPHEESLHLPCERDTKAETALDLEIERPLTYLAEPNKLNIPESNPLGAGVGVTLPAVSVGIEGIERVHQDGETPYLYALEKDHRMPSVEGSGTLGAALEECVTGTTSSGELWEIPSQCLTADEHVVEDHSSASSLGELPSINSHHTDPDPETRSGLVGLGTVGYQIEWTQHPDAPLEISSFSIPSALLPQYNNSSVVMEEAGLFEGVHTMYSRSSVDDSTWASDGQGDVAFQALGQEDTVSASLQVGHGSDVTESKVPALGGQRDISQTAKSSSPEHFRRPDPDLEVVPTIGGISEQEESSPGSEHSTFPSDTKVEEPAFDGLLDGRSTSTEDVPDGKGTRVHPLVSKEEQPLQRASHEPPFSEGLRATLCLPKERTDVHKPHHQRVQQVETGRSQDTDLGEAYPLASGTDASFPSEELISQSWLVDPVVGGFNEVEETSGVEYFGEGPQEADNVPPRAHPFGFNVDFMRFHSHVPTLFQGAGEDVLEPPAASSLDLDNADYEVHAAGEVMDNLPLDEDSTVDTSSGWETDHSIIGSSSPPIKIQTPKPIHFFNPSTWLEQSRPPRPFAEEETAEPHDDHVRFCSPVNPQVFLNSIPVSPPIHEALHRDGSVLGAETSPMPDLSPASENVFLSPQIRFAPVTVIAGTAEPKTPSNWAPTWKVPDDSVLQAFTRKIGSPKLGKRANKVYRTNDAAGAAETPHRQSTPVLVSHLHLAEEKALGERAGRAPDRLPSLTPKLFKIAPVSVHSKALFKQVAVSEDAACPGAEEGPQSAERSTCEAAVPEQGMDCSTSEPVQLRERLDPLMSSNFVRRHSKLINSSRLLYQEYSDVALNQAIERQKRAETFLEESEPSSPRLRRKLMSSPDSYLQRLSVSSSASLWQDIPMIRGTSTLLSMTREEQKLQEAKFELIMSEASYLRSLNIAVDHFQHSPDLQTLLSNQERQWLFSRLQEVRDVSSNFLFDLEEKFEDNIYTFNVCDVVLSHAPDFQKVYVPYVTNQSYQDQTFQRLLNGNPRFQQVLEKLESHPVCQRRSLKSFLILPFQRITRLKLVVQNILKRTRPGSREEGQATQAYSLLEKLIKDCNENVQRMRSTEELIYLSQKIEFECKICPLISQSRRLVKHGELVQLESSAPLSFKWKVITRPIYLHLFNDCLLLSRRREGARFLVFDHARVTKVHGEKCEMKMHGNSKNIFRLILQENNQGRRTEFLLRTETQSEKLRWIAALSPQKKKPDFLQCHDNPQVQCLKSYKAREHDELSLEKADVIMVTQQSKDGWMEGTRLSDGEHGWFPVENVEDISCKHVRLRNLKEEQRVQYARAKLIPIHHRR